jgi:hypothetical protein
VLGHGEAEPAQVQHREHRSIVPPGLGSPIQVASTQLLGHDRQVDDAVELSSLLASLEEISARVSALVERQTGSDGIDSELVALERSLTGAVRRLQRASRSAARRG